jgi:hypothetical protein
MEAVPVHPRTHKTYLGICRENSGGGFAFSSYLKSQTRLSSTIFTCNGRPYGILNKGKWKLEHTFPLLLTMEILRRLLGRGGGDGGGDHICSLETEVNGLIRKLKRH